MKKYLITLIVAATAAILRQQIGEGGFGMVWMAEQMEPVKRMVALKVIKAGMDTRQVLARFEAERQALAMMNHPNIAKVLEAGATSSGRPYFTMELVKGIPITNFCDQRQLDARQRLELFRDVCSAVQHAHQKGVIHRDLKPSNVMVTLAGDKPLVKIIDFGIAKATQSSLVERTLFTRFGQFLGTPVYMSPEQAAILADQRTMPIFVEAEGDRPGRITFQPVEARAFAPDSPNIPNIENYRKSLERSAARAAASEKAK